MGGVPLILESLVAFRSEISIIAARGTDGSLAAYDPAENVHRDGILHTSTVPAAVSPATAELARRNAFAILEALDYVGVVGVEFFVLGDGSLLVNEIAPRVHNSGHWTEAACAISQFEQHIRAVAGLPLGVVLAFPLGFKGSGIWTGLFVGLAVVAVLLLSRWLRRERLGLTDKRHAFD